MMTFRTALAAASQFKNKAVVTTAILDLRGQMPLVEFQPIPRAATREDLEILYASACVALAEELEVRDAAAAACEIVNGGGGRAVPNLEVQALQAEDLEAILQAESDAAWAAVVASAPPEALAVPAVTLPGAVEICIDGPRPTGARAVVLGMVAHIADERAQVIACLEAAHLAPTALGPVLVRARQLFGRTDQVRRAEKVFAATLPTPRQPSEREQVARDLRSINARQRTAPARLGDVSPVLARLRQEMFAET